MISRRALSGLLMTLVGPSSVTGNTLALSHCRGSCANVDLPTLGYDTFCRSFFDLAASGKLRAVATGPAVRREMRSLFRARRLYRPSREEMRVLWRDTAAGFSVVKVEFDLECGVPVRGCLGSRRRVQGIDPARPRHGEYAGALLRRRRQGLHERARQAALPGWLCRLVPLHRADRKSGKPEQHRRDAGIAWHLRAQRVMRIDRRRRTWRGWRRNGCRPQVRCRGSC